jgi:hypothetical protein
MCQFARRVISQLEALLTLGFIIQTKVRNRTRLKAFALHSTTNRALERMDVLEAIIGRRGVRASRNEDVSQETVDRLTSPR